MPLLTSDAYEMAVVAATRALVSGYEGLVSVTVAFAAHEAESVHACTRLAESNAARRGLQVAIATTPSGISARFARLSRPRL